MPYIRSIEENDYTILKNTATLSSFSDDLLRELTQDTNCNCFHDGQMIFSQGDPAKDFFVVLSGRVRLYNVSQSGKMNIIHIIDAGESFALAAILKLSDQNQLPSYPVDADALGACEILPINGNIFTSLLQREKGLMAKVITNLITWERFLQHEIQELKDYTPIERLASFILATAEKAGSPKIPSIAKHIIANRVGITPESLSRSLRKLENLDLLQKGSHIIIKDIEGIRNLLKSS
jgi:CRP-like cAMP-binding protein